MSKQYILILTEGERKSLLQALENVTAASTPQDYLPGVFTKAEAVRDKVHDAPSFGPIRSAIEQLCGYVEADEADLKLARAAERLRAWIDRNAEQKMTLAVAAQLGREHGKAQRNTTRNCMLYNWQHESDRHWEAYLAGFYRGAGYAGSGNRHQRRQT